jgi:hypothetical protein
VVAMSSTTGGSSPPGTATAIGLVDSSMSSPPQGGRWLALPTAKYRPIMSCAIGMRAYSEAGPAWLLMREPTHAMPQVRALSIAICAAFVITRWPMPLSPSSSAMPGRSCTTLMSGCRLMPPARMRLA